MGQRLPSLPYSGGSFLRGERTGLTSPKHCQKGTFRDEQVAGRAHSASKSMPISHFVSHAVHAAGLKDGRATKIPVRLMGYDASDRRMARPRGLEPLFSP
jgi:hypothetical protein